LLLGRHLPIGLVDLAEPDIRIGLIHSSLDSYLLMGFYNC